MPGGRRIVRRRSARQRWMHMPPHPLLQIAGIALHAKGLLEGLRRGEDDVPVGPVGYEENSNVIRSAPRESDGYCQNRPSSYSKPPKLRLFLSHVASPQAARYARLTPNITLKVSYLRSLNAARRRSDCCELAILAWYPKQNLGR